MRNISETVDKHRKLILDTEKYIWSNPETGCKEIKTSKYMEDVFTSLGYDIVRAEGLTGFYTCIDTGREGPKVLIFGELDSVICPTHPDSDKKTGAVHSCGHNAQCAALVGIAAALKEPGMLDGLCGKIMLCAVPAEEFIEIEYRKKLQEEGKISYLGGKSEFLSRGYFDEVDIAFMVHTSDSYSCNSGGVGFVSKKIIYKGVAAHAGGSPWDGCNALYAANCGINAVNAIRETFKEKDLIRFHPIITNGGDIVNAIPETTEIESYVRGSTYDGILENNAKVNRALIGAALSLGANIEIVDMPGYAPLINDRNMIDIAAEAAEMLDIEFRFDDFYNTGSTDLGDLSMVMPVIQPYAGGARGKSHGNNYEIYDPEAACVTNAKWQLTMLEILLKDGAARAQKVIREYTPTFATKEEFLAFQSRLNTFGDRIEYKDNSEAVIKL